MRGRALTAEQRVERTRQKTLQNFANEMPSGMMSWAQVHPERERGEDYDRLGDIHGKDASYSTARERGEHHPDPTASRRQRSAMWTHGLLAEGDTRFPVQMSELQEYRWRRPVAPSKAFWVQPSFVELPRAPKPIPATVRSITVGDEYENAKRAQKLKVCRERMTWKFKAQFLRESWGERLPRHWSYPRVSKSLATRRALFWASRALYWPRTHDHRAPWVRPGLTIHLAVVLSKDWIERLDAGYNGQKVKGAEFGVLKIVTDHATDEQRAWWAKIHTPAWIVARAALSTREVLDFENDIMRAPEGRVTPNLPKYYPRDSKYFPRRWRRLPLCSWINGQDGPTVYVRYWRCGWLGRYQIETTIVSAPDRPRYVTTYNMDDEAIVIQVRTGKSRATAYRLIEEHGRTWEEVFAGLLRKRLQRKTLTKVKEE